MIKYLRKTIELTDAEYEQIRKCPNYKYKTISGHVVKGLDSTVINNAKVCKASDPALNLTKDINGFYYAADDKQLQQMCACSSIDYAIIGNINEKGCPDCTQDTLNACQLESISGKDPVNGYSLAIFGPMSKITSLQGFARLSGALPGGFWMQYMDELTTLEGLDNIARIGQGMYGSSIVLINNPKLASAMALSNAKGPFTSDALYIYENPQLACVPEQWPAKDSRGETIRRHPCLYKHGTHHVGQGDYCGKISLEECGEGTPCNSFADCPAICNSATICPGLLVGDDVKFDCSLKGTYC